MSDDLTYPAEALRVAHANGVQRAFSLTDIKRAFMEGVVSVCGQRREPAPQWMVEQLWNESAVKQRAERTLQGS